MKKVFFLLSILIATISQAQVTVVGYVSTQGVANYPTHIDSMGKGGYMSIQDSFKRNNIPCLRRKYGMAVYVQNLQKLYILKDSACNNVWEEFSGGGGGGVSQIIAGSNISISPTGGTGIVTINSTGGGSGNSAFGYFFDKTTQTPDSPVNQIRISDADSVNKFELKSNKIISQDSGFFNFQITVQIKSTLTYKNANAIIWLRKNSQNVEATTKRISSLDSFDVMTFDKILKLNQYDTVEYYWSSTEPTYTEIYNIASSSSPKYPNGASVTVSVTPIGGGGGGGGTQNLQSVLNIGHDLVDGLNFQGTGAGVGNTGLYVNAFGDSAALNNTGNYVNAIGDSALIGNTGVNVNAFGKNSGNGNTFNNVNLFGENSSADDNSQIVFAKSGTNARIDYNCIGENRKYKLPNFSGYFVISDYAEFSATSGTSYTIPAGGGNYQFRNVNASYNLTVELPYPTDGCYVKGQRIVITNVAASGVNDNYAIDLLNPDGKIYYRGSNIQIDRVGIGETIELYSDGSDWRTISSLPEPRVLLDMNDGDYYINSNGTYVITNATGDYRIYFPQPRRMIGSKITIINRDCDDGQPYGTSNAPVTVCGDGISEIAPGRAHQYVSDGDDWVRIDEF